MATWGTFFLFVGTLEIVAAAAAAAAGQASEQGGIISAEFATTLSFRGLTKVTLRTRIRYDVMYCDQDEPEPQSFLISQSGTEVEYEIRLLPKGKLLVPLLNGDGLLCFAVKDWQLEPFLLYYPHRNDSAPVFRPFHYPDSALREEIAKYNGASQKTLRISNIALITLTLVLPAVILLLNFVMFGRRSLVR